MKNVDGEANCTGGKVCLGILVGSERRETQSGKVQNVREYPRASKWRAEYVGVWSLSGVGSHIHQDLLGPAAFTWPSISCCPKRRGEVLKPRLFVE